MRNTGELIADTYALGAGDWTMTPVARGALGQIWKLSGNGTAWAVKELLFEKDEPDVGAESALRDAAETLGISAPRLMPDRTGAHVVRLPEGSYVKLYDWVDGTAADPSDPATLRWCGRTLAILHTAGAARAGHRAAGTNGATRSPTGPNSSGRWSGPPALGGGAGPVRRHDSR